jgi:uncharacterized membrane protein
MCQMLLSRLDLFVLRASSVLLTLLIESRAALAGGSSHLVRTEVAADSRLTAAGEKLCVREREFINTSQKKMNKHETEITLRNE